MVLSPSYNTQTLDPEKYQPLRSKAGAGEAEIPEGLGGLGLKTAPLPRSVLSLLPTPPRPQHLPKLKSIDSAPLASQTPTSPSWADSLSPVQKSSVLPLCHSSQSHPCGSIWGTKARLLPSSVSQTQSWLGPPHAKDSFHHLCAHAPHPSSPRPPALRVQDGMSISRLSPLALGPALRGSSVHVE